MFCFTTMTCLSAILRFSVIQSYSAILCISAIISSILAPRNHTHFQQEVNNNNDSISYYYFKHLCLLSVFLFLYMHYIIYTKRKKAGFFCFACCALQLKWPKNYFMIPIPSSFAASQHSNNLYQI